MKQKLIRTAVVLALLPFTAYADEMTTPNAIDALQLTELAQTYNQQKIIKSTGMQEASQSDALLIDMGVITQADLSNKAILSDKLTAFVKDQNDLSEHYIGNVYDKNIAERIKKAWLESTVLDDPTPLSLLNSFIDKGLTTGYNVINKADQSHFNNELMIRYGHNNIQHAIQLLYLMKSEHFNPKVQLIPKSSAFLYLPEWGHADYPVMTLESGKMVAVVKEYNLDFEFESVERKQSFMKLIDQYAKKDSAEEQGLIFDAWWQPFYRSYTEMENYIVLTENRIDIGDYQADLMVLPEEAEKQQQGLNALSGKDKVSSEKVWVNPSFYRYMIGESK
jgi:hypothetical protein